MSGGIIMSVKYIFSYGLMLQIVFAVAGDACNAARRLDEDVAMLNTDCAICLVATSAEDVCVCRGVRAAAKGRDSCISLFFPYSSCGREAQELLIGDEVDGASGHYFHQACLKDWLQRGGDCPLCRKKFSPDERIKLWDDVVFRQRSLGQAAATGNILRAKNQLWLGVPINVCDVVGFAPLHYAARYGHCEVVRELLAVAGVVVDINDLWGNTPLYWAAYGGHKDIVKMLIAAGAVVTRRDVDIAYEQGHWLLSLMLHMQ